MAYQLTVAGLGPAGAELMTRGTWARIEAAEQILLRTRIHPTVEALDAAGISYETYDDFYERADDFDELYEAITDDLFARAAMSFLEPLFAALGIDPVNGVSIIDAMDEDTVATPPAQDLIITQLYSRELASDLKILLMEHFPDTQVVIYLHHLGLSDERVAHIPLFELDWQEDIDHLTTLFIPYTPVFWENG